MLLNVIFIDVFIIIVYMRPTAGHRAFLSIKCIDLTLSSKLFFLIHSLAYTCNNVPANYYIMSYKHDIGLYDSDWTQKSL